MMNEELAYRRHLIVPSLSCHSDDRKGRKNLLPAK